MRPTLSIALAAILLVATEAGVDSQRQSDPIDRIRAADLEADLFALAGDRTKGREGGTIDELAASVWLAERARDAGLQPAGDDGTFFQFFPLERFRVSPSSIVTIGGKTLRMGRDVVTDAVVLAEVDAPLVNSKPDTVAGPEVKGSAIVTWYVPSSSPATGNAANALRTWARGIHRTATQQGAVATIVLVPDSALEQWERVAMPFPRGTYQLDPDGTADQRTPTRGAPLLYER
jgi:hypothetical protein